MSRYSNNYNQIIDKFNQINNILEQINIQNINNENIKLEALRFKKNFTVLNDIIENIDPETIKGDISGNINHINNVISSLNSFKSTSQSLSYIQQANNYLDNISAFIRPYILHRKRLKNSLANAINEYIETVENHLKDLNLFKKELSEAKEIKEKIEEYYNELVVGYEDTDSIKEKINNIFEDIEQKKSKIYSFYNELFDDEEELSIQSEIRNFKDEIDDTKIESNRLKEKIEDIVTETSNTLNELKRFYVEIFGEYDEEIEERVGGLKKEIEKRLNNLDELEEKHKSLIEEEQKKYHSLVEQINGLLPSATSVGMAKVYYDKRKEFQEQTNFWSNIFIGTMIAIFGFGVYIVSKDIQFDYKNFLHYSPLYGSIIWLAIFAIKRRNEAMRLEQEYTHKETLANSYMSYKMQIEEIKNDDEKNKLLQKLLESATFTITQNPNYVLDKKDNESHPFFEFFTKIWEKK